MAFGNAGTHLPHAMSYGVTHLMHDVTTADYPVGAPFVPHGISVIVCAPAVFRYLAQGAPQRHLEAAALLGADCRDASADDAGEVVAQRLIELMRAAGAPNGLRGVGFAPTDVQALAASSARQKRAIANAPREADLGTLETIYSAALSYW
jgi:alcohol dehydrogenase class IV